jgi:hypothetical protein
MGERNQKDPVMSWRMIGISVLAMVGAIGLALLLIEPLSLRAAIQGGLIAIGSLVVTQLALRWWFRTRRK